MRIIALILVATVFLLTVPVLSGDIPVLAQDDGYESVSPELAEQIAEIYRQKQALTPTQKKIDQHLLKVTRKAKEKVAKLPPGEKRMLRELTTPLLRIDDTGNIDVKLTVRSQTDGQLQQLKDLGLNIGLTLPKYGLIEGSLPYDQIEAVAGLDFVISVGRPGYAIHNTGEVTSLGDTVLRAAEARTTFGVDGSGVKVGVISDGVDHLANSVASGDLPSSPAVDVLEAGSGDEGTAMLEIVHDLAPGAPLAFYSPATSANMVAGIGLLQAAGCKVIVDDLTFFDEPKFEDGPIAQEARNFFNIGGVYVTSAGNNAGRHYTATYNRDGIVSVGGIDYYAHDYDTSINIDIGNTFNVTAGGSIITILQWNNQWGSSGDDFDLFLVRSSNGQVLAYSDDPQDGNDNPYEILSWTNITGTSIKVYIGVFEYSLASPEPSSLVLDYNVYYGSGLQYVTPEDSLIGHAAVEEVLSTAAADAATPGTIESFSSRGPATIYFPSQESRQVPNITGVDGVQTKTGQLGHFYNPFYGTSAAAPHVAAIAALVWDADPALTSSDVSTVITSTAVDLPPSGWDGTWGFGRVDAYAAVENALNRTTVGTLSLIPTCQSIGVYSNFSGDANENNQAILEYKASSSSQWLTAPPLTVDRRDTVVSNGSTISNAYKNQYRGSVLFLEANTEYDVRVTYTDDGSSDTVQDTVNTLNDNPPSTGNTYYVATTGHDTSGNGSFENPWLTIQYAADNVIAGDTVRIMPGTYSEQVILSVSGNATNYITFQSHHPNDRAIIGSPERGTFRLNDISYVRLKELNIVGSDNDASCVFVSGSNSNRTIVEDCNLSSVGTNWWAGGVIVCYGPTNTLIQRNQISTTAVGSNGPFGVLLYEVGGGTVIRNNTITGGFYDGIGGAPNFGINGGPYHDSDIYDNYIEGIYDDAIESEGGNINVRIWGNVIKNPYTMGLGIGSTIIGPLYIFRNTIHGFTEAAIKMGHQSTGVTYIYHNTVYATVATANGPCDYAGYYGIGNVKSRNNIYQVGRYVIETIGIDLGGNSYDYDNMFTTDPGRFVKWHGSLYPTLPSFQTGTGQELNAISTDSEFVDPASDNLTLQLTSPCIDQGVILPGFNDADSPWPYQGLAPDLGAYEAAESVATQPPTVTTESATLVNATTATLNGTIIDDGGGSCLYRFEYDTDSGDPYAYNTGWVGNKTTGQSFSANITGLSPGTTYYFRAQARNSIGTSSGSDLTFITTTEEIISFTVTDYMNDGVQFGYVNPGVSDQPSDWGGSQGAVTLTIGAETNVNVNVQPKGSDFSGPDIINISNVKYNNAENPTEADTLTDIYVTWYAVEPPLTTDNVTQVYYWLSIPSGQAPGTYTSTFYYRAAKSE